MSRGVAFDVALAIELRRDTLVALAAGGIANRRANRAGTPGSPRGVALLQRERRGGGASKLVWSAKVAGIRTGIAARCAAGDVVYEVGLTGIAHLRVGACRVALVLAD
jgi:hypothetical protein